MTTHSPSRLENNRLVQQRTILLLGVGTLLVLLLAPSGASAQEPPHGYRGAVVSEAVVPFVFEGDLRDLPTAADWQPGDPIKEIPRRHYFGPGEDIQAPPGKPQTDPLLELQENAPAAVEGDGFATPILNFDGQGFTGVNPPDTVGDVGPGHYIQMINGSGGAQVTIHDKSDGSILSGPFELDTLGSGSCAAGFGDPIVLYDRLADRWMMSEFADVGSHLCVYVSMTNDPISGGWFGYDFTTPNFPDYPKYAVWPDAYYVSSNESGPSALYALDRASMLSGAPATSQRFTVADLSGFGFQALTPADLDGADPPPADAPGIFMRHRDTEVHGPAGSPTTDLLEMWEFHVDWDTPGNSTLTELTAIDVSEFDSDLCGLISFSCFPQPSGPQLDPLREVIMWRLQYRNFGSHQALIGNLVTDVSGADHGGVRWFELRKTGGGPWTLFQEGTFAPDTDHRWMGAISMDSDGNMAVGYNISSTSTFPSLGYVGRLAGDPLGTMPQGEHPLVAGSASNGSNRYGDYSAMSVDPEDDCTYWFTGEYNAASGWSTRIGKFKFDSCVPGPDFTIAVTPQELTICAPLDAEYLVEIDSLLGFNDLVTLAITGEPAGTTTDFSVNPVTPPGTSDLTIGDTGMASPGDYSLEISGTSTTGTKSRTVGLAVFSDTPSAPTLLTPIDNAVDVSLVPTFMWTASTQGRDYTLEIDDDPGFGSPDYTATVTETSHTIPTALAQTTQYYWRVSPANQCGDGILSATFSFTTRELPPVLLVDDDDNTPDVRAFYTSALDALGVDYDVWDTGNSDNEPGLAELAGYEQVVWFSGDEFGGAAGPGSAGEGALAGYLDTGGCLFISSQDYHYDRGLTSFMEDYLGVAAMVDDVGDYISVSGEPGSIFDGLGPYALDHSVPGVTDYSDPVDPNATALQALLGNNSNGAAVQKLFEPLAQDGIASYSTVFFAFTWEALDTTDVRETVLQTILDFCPAGPPPTEIFIDGFESGDASAWTNTQP